MRVRQIHQHSGSSAKASAASAATSVVMKRTLAVLGGMTPAEAIAKYPGSATEGEGGVGTPRNTSASIPAAQPVGGAAAGTTYYTPEEGSEASGMLLNYLLGN